MLQAEITAGPYGVAGWQAEEEAAMAHGTGGTTACDPWPFEAEFCCRALLQGVQDLNEQPRLARGSILTMFHAESAHADTFQGEVRFQS